MDCRADEVINAFEDKRNPKLPTISWPAIMGIGLFAAFLPAIFWGCIITMIAWEIFDHALALGIGMGAFLSALYMGAMTAIVMTLVPVDWVKEIK